MSIERKLESHPTISVLNAVRQAAMHPRTFRIEDWRDVKVGYFIKACFSQDGLNVGERMWSKVLEIKDGLFYCELNNDPEFLSDIKCDDKLVLHPEEVMNWLKA